MKFAIIETATGRITQTCTASVIADVSVTCDTAHHAASAPDAVNDHTHYAVGGTFVAFPASPSTNHRWDWATKAWADPRTLAQHQTDKWTQIKAARDAAINAALTTPYGMFDCNEASRTNITDAVLMLQTLAGLGTPTTIDFTLADNSTVTLTTTQMVTVGLLLGQKVQTAHGQGRARRAAIDAATTTAQVDAVVW